MTVHLTLAHVLALADEAGLAPVRDIGLLDSAIQRPRTTLFGDDAYPTLDEKAAVILESIVRNHPLVDGNKRLGFLATVVSCGRNDVMIDAPEDDAYDPVIAVATGAMDYHESAARLAAWTQ